jgi:hypothetical protein
MGIGAAEIHDRGRAEPSSATFAVQCSWADSLASSVMNLDARHARSVVAHDRRGYLGKDRSRSRDGGIDLADAATDHIDAVRGAVGVPIGCSSN